MEQKNQAPLSPYIMPSSVLVIFFGAFNGIMCLAYMLNVLRAGVAAEAYASEIGLMSVMGMIGALQVVSGVLGLKGRTKRSLLNVCKYLGYAMLLATAGYTVTTVYMRGFQWSTIWSIVAAVFYLSSVRPQKVKEKPPEEDGGGAVDTDKFPY